MTSVNHVNLIYLSLNSQINWLESFPKECFNPLPSTNEEHNGFTFEHNLIQMGLLSRDFLSHSFTYFQMPEASRIIFIQKSKKVCESNFPQLLLQSSINYCTTKKIHQNK